MATTPDNPRLTFEDRVHDGLRELVLVKHGQRYVFRCAVGREAEMLAQLGALIRDHGPEGLADGAGSLDWFDAAVISHQIGRRLADPMHRPMRKAS